NRAILGTTRVAEATALLRLLEDARRRLETFRAELYLRQPELRPRRTPLGEGELVTRGFVRSDALVLDYVVMPKETIVFVIARGGENVTAVRLPITAERLKMLSDELTRAVAQRDLRYDRHARALYELLIRPVARQLATHHELIVIPDGVLWRVPFQVLLDRDD